MNEIIAICVIGIVTCTILITADIIKYFRARKFVRSTINNCFDTLKEKDVNTNDRKN